LIELADRHPAADFVALRTRRDGPGSPATGVRAVPAARLLARRLQVDLDAVVAAAVEAS